MAQGISFNGLITYCIGQEAPGKPVVPLDWHPSELGLPTVPHARGRHRLISFPLFATANPQAHAIGIRYSPARYTRPAKILSKLPIIATPPTPRTSGIKVP